jgi:ferritin-like metal-binding protein YciE
VGAALSWCLHRQRCVERGNARTATVPRLGLARLLQLMLRRPKLPDIGWKEHWMPIGSTRELFVHELSDAMSAEQQILKMLPELQKEALNAGLKQALRTHEMETQQQVKNLQAVFKQLGEKPEETTCYGIKGLADEHAALHEEQPSPEMLELANISGAANAEHYEMVMYTGLVQMAKDLGERDAAQLLQVNLDQEKAMAKRIESLAKTVSKQASAAEKERSATTANGKAAR